ncbi:MAG: hypothetical protein PUA88_03210 [Bacillales bacterium]|nr:hypothetical protein [Bacillales bacterium]
MITKKKYKGMFVAASIFGFISAFINFVYIGMFKEVDSSSYITILIVLSVIAIISGIGFLIVALMKNEKTLYNHLGVIKVCCLLSVFGSIITMILAWNGYNIVKMNALIDSGEINNIFPNGMNNYFYQNNDVNQTNNEENQIDENDVIDAQYEEKEMTYESFQEELEALNKKLEAKQISEEEFYDRKNEILKKYYK